MSKKKLLNESQIRRFMGLAGMQSNLVSNYLKEADLKEEEVTEEVIEEAVVEETTDNNMEW